MKAKDMRNAGIIALAAGAVLVPLGRYLWNRRKAAMAGSETAPASSGKGLFSAYRGKHHPHHRKPQQDGQPVMH